MWTVGQLHLCPLYMKVTLADTTAAGTNVQPEWVDNTSPTDKERLIDAAFPSMCSDSHINLAKSFRSRTYTLHQPKGKLRKSFPEFAAH